MSSWVALWLAEDTTFSDVLAVILAIIFLAYAYNSVMPRVSYVKLLDLYMCSCFLFVFLSLAKLVIIKYFCHKWAKESNRSSDFFLNQLVAASAGGVDIEQHPNGEVVNRDSESRRSSLSVSKEEKKKKAKEADSKKKQLNRNGSVLKDENGLLLPPPNANGDPKKDDNDQDDYHSAVYPIVEEEVEENMKNEEIEAAFTFVRDDTKPQDEEQVELEPSPVNALAPLAALFPNSMTSSNNSNGAASRRVTFLGLEAFAAWFDHQEKKKKNDVARYMRYLRCFHVVTQLALPCAFAAFFVFLLLIYPNVPRSDYC